jgi:hypothetical protein
MERRQSVTGEAKKVFVVFEGENGGVGMPPTHVRYDHLKEGLTAIRMGDWNRLESVSQQGP